MGVCGSKNGVEIKNMFSDPYFIKKGKKGKRSTIYLDFGENSNFEMFWQFFQKSRFTFFGTLFTLCLAEAKKYFICTLCSINGFQIDQKAKKVSRFENFVWKSRQNVLFLANISKFHKIVLSYTEKGYFGPQKKHGDRKWVMFLHLQQKG
jgi:hypothetical protein